MNRFAIYLLALGAFVTGTAEFVVSGILEIISADLHVSIAAAGQLITIYSLSYAIGALVLVMLTAKFNRKKVLMYALLTFIAGNIVALFSLNFGMLMLSRIILASSGGLYTVIATSYAARLASPQKQGNAIATVITGFSVSLILGVPFGTLIAAYIDWRYIYLIIAVVTLLNLLLLQKFIPKFEGASPVPLKQQFLLIKDKQVISGLATTVFWILGYTMVFAYIAPMMSELAGFSIEMISSALLVLGVSAFIGSRFGGYAVDRWGPIRTILFSLILHSATLFVLTPATASTVTLLLTIMIWGAATWTTTPANQFYLISLRPQSSEVVLSFNTAFMNIGMTLGAGLGGIVIEYMNIQHMGWIGGVTVLLAVVTASYSFRIGLRKRSQNMG
ncbi:MFS transporter [Paenibacillus elgii]